MVVYDTINNIPIECPKCGDGSLKSVSLMDQKSDDIDENLHFNHDFGKKRKKSLVLRLRDRYDFAKDNKIRGIVDCNHCRNTSIAKYRSVADEFEKKPDTYTWRDIENEVQKRFGEDYKYTRFYVLVEFNKYDVPIGVEVDKEYGIEEERRIKQNREYWEEQERQGDILPSLK